jgi:hypothetical protein
MELDERMPGQAQSRKRIAKDGCFHVRPVASGEYHAAGSRFATARGEKQPGAVMLIEPSDVRFESGVNPGKVGHIIKNNQVHVIIQLASAAADQNLRSRID